MEIVKGTFGISDCPSNFNFLNLFPPENDYGWYAPICSGPKSVYGCMDRIFSEEVFIFESYVKSLSEKTPYTSRKSSQFPERVLMYESSVKELVMLEMLPLYDCHI